MTTLDCDDPAAFTSFWTALLGGAAMVFKLGESAQARWRAITTAHLVLLVRAGACFENGHLIERPSAVAA